MKHTREILECYQRAAAHAKLAAFIAERCGSFTLVCPSVLVDDDYTPGVCVYDEGEAKAAFGANGWVINYEDAHTRSFAKLISCTIAEVRVSYSVTTTT